MIDYRQVFEQSPARLLLVDPQPGYEILQASVAYLEATLTTREIIGQPIFNVFPDNPADATSHGVSNLRASFERVLARRGADHMVLQRYDIRDRSGAFVERHWIPLNTPTLASDGTVAALIHRVEDVTSFVKEGEFLQGEAARLRSEIPHRLATSRRRTRCFATALSAAARWRPS